MSSVWGPLIYLGFFIAPTIVAIACVRYAMRVRSRAAIFLAVGSCGELAVSFTSRFASLLVLPRLANGVAESARSLAWFNVVAAAFGVVFALIFAVALWLMLRDEFPSQSRRLPLTMEDDGPRPVSPT